MNVGDARASDRPASREFGHLRRLVRYLKPYGWRIVGAVLALTVAAGTVLSLGVGLRFLIDEGFSSGDPALLDTALLALLMVVALLAASTFARFYLVSWIGERVVADIRRDVYDHVITLSPSFFEITKTGEVLTRLTTDTTLLQVVVGSSASVALRNLLLFLGGSVMLAVTSLKLTGLVFVLVPLVVLPIIVFGRRVRRLSRATQDRVADIGSHVEESVNAIRTVQAFTHEAIDRGQFGDRVEQAFDVAVRRVRARALLTALVMTSVFGAVALVLWVGGRDVLVGDLSAGQLSQFVFFAVVVAGAVGAISEVYGDLQRAAGATERLLELLSVLPDVRPPARPVPLPEPARGEIRFDKVTFHYPTRPDAPSLDDIDFAVAPGERVAVVGPSGAGKTTLFQLLLRFYDPQAGRVVLDGVDLREAAPDQIRSRLAVVPQEPVIFAADALENIRYGRPDASDAEVRAAAEAAAADRFLDEQPDGVETFLGEKGVRLSGGQRQRIAIARAILRDPAVLLLDEATSALDSESEHLVQQALERLMANRTTLVIAHRLATVQNADRIVVLDRGRIVATGSHDQLMAQGGLYARLADLQFSVDTPAAAGLAAQ
jgi:ATP-binding cassette subfamily B protein